MAKSLGKESVADLRTQKDGGGGVRNRGGSRGVWAPSEAAAAARGVAAANAAAVRQGRDDLEGGEAGGGKHGFRSVLAASASTRSIDGAGSAANAGSPGLTVRSCRGDA